jgi:invasion protein IalB
MRLKLVILAVVLVVGVLAGVYAYRSSDSAEAAPAAGTADSSASASATPSVKPGESLWKKRCESDKDEPGKCEAFQLVTETKTQKRFMEVAFGYPEKGDQASVVIILPLGVMVAAGGTLQADSDKDGKKFPIVTCVPAGCVGRFKLDADFVTRLKGAKALTVGMYGGDGKPLNVKLPLDGFKDAIESIKRL